MKSVAVVPALLARSPDGLPFAPAFGDIYHPRAGALAQARHVFLAGNGLPRRWAGRERFVVLETGFGLGNNFLATWAAWREDPQRCERLHYVAIERHPPTRADLETLAREPELAALAAQLAESWPPLLRQLHRLSFDDARVQLLLAFGDAQEWLRELVLRADAIYLDGFAPDRNPQMWSPSLLKAVARLAAPDATAATWSAARAVRDGLRGAGFEVERRAGSGGKRDTVVARAATPAAARREPPGRPHARPVERHAVIVGAGLAGCAAAWALAQQGWRSTLIDRHDAPAREASGNPAGLFHGVVHAHDGAHARWFRAAAIEARHVVRHAIDQHGVRGAADGLLRLDDAPAARMRELLARLGLPPEVVQALDASQASALAGVPLARCAWLFPGGGWVDPAGLCTSFLRRAGDALQWRGGTQVARLEALGDRWQLHVADGSPIADASTVVLANAGDALSLLGEVGWPLQRLRGQVSIADAASWRAGGGALPRLPIAGGAYLLPEIDARVLFGATSQRDDPDATVRANDHRRNLEQLRGIVDTPAVPPDLQGRTAWRCAAIDRLPLVGAVPDLAAAMACDPTQPRFVPRRPGLFVCIGLGSRGITSAALAAQVLASWVCGAPVPVEAGLLDAVDPARFVARSVRRAASRAASLRPA